MSRKANHQLLYLAAPALLLLLFGCSNSLHEREAVNAFASNYIEFHKAVYDSEISMWVIALDVSGQVGDPSTVSAGLKGTHFRRYRVSHLSRRRVRNTPVRWLLHRSKQS